MVMRKWGAGGIYGFFGGGAFMHLAERGGGFSLRFFGAESRSFGRWWREVVKLEYDEVEGEEVVLGKLWGVRLKRCNFDEGFVFREERVW